MGDIPPKMTVGMLEAKWKPRSGYRTTVEEEKTHRTYFGSKVWHNAQLKVLHDYPVPKMGSKDVLIRVKACGICGSDLHMIEKDADGYMLYPGLTKLPVVLGHEFSGEIVKIGREVPLMKAGDMVTCEEMWWCGECDPCRTDNLNQCRNLEEMGFTKDGAYAEYITANYKYCWKINEFSDTYKSEEKAYGAGALVEPATVAYNAMFVRAGGFKPGAYVAVWGAGPIGLAAISLAKAAGASKIIVFEVAESRRKIAEEIGANYTFDPIKLEKSGTQPSEEILDVTGGNGLEMLIEASGAPRQVLPQMEKALAIGAKVAWIGRADVAAPIFMELFQTRAAQLFGAQGHSGFGTFRNVIRLMASGKVDLTKMITGAFSLEKVNDAVNRLKDRKDVKILIRP